jgi:hypothetical protein
LEQQCEGDFIVPVAPAQTQTDSSPVAPAQTQTELHNRKLPTSLRGVRMMTW